MRERIKEMKQCGNCLHFKENRLACWQTGKPTTAEKTCLKWYYKDSRKYVKEELQNGKQGMQV